MSLLCFDAGGTALKYGLVDKNANLTQEGSVPTPHDSFESFSAAIKSIYEQFAARAQIQGIALSLPGRNDSKRGYCYSGGYLNYNAQRAVGPELEEILGLPVVLENDAKAACRAEMWNGALKGISSGVVLVLGTGLGGGIVVNSQLFSGPTGAAGELSFFLRNILEEHLELQSLGSLWVSSTGLLTFAAQEYGLPYHLDMEKGFAMPMNGIEFFAKVAAHEEPALRALKRFGRTTGRMIFSLCSVLDSERIAIGGGISAQPALIEACREGTHECFTSEYPLPPSSLALTEPEIVACTFRNGANLIGAAHGFQEKHPEIELS